MIFKIILYLIAIGICTLFALYMSASVGWVFVYMLVCAPIFSFGVTLFLKLTKKVSVHAEISSGMLYKGESSTLRIIAENKSIYPVPAVKIKLFSPKSLSSSEGSTSCVMSIPPRSRSEIRVNYTARVWGICRIGVEFAFMHDFMGFFRFSVPCFDNVHEIKVFPNIPEIPADAPLLRSAVERVKFYDDIEETKESENNSDFGGMPGYTHREYVVGDPVRRINWKLSSKRDKYMVRLDDEIETVRQVIVLDPYGGNDIFENERAVEGMLASALGLLKSGFESTLYCRFKGSFECFEISEPADVSALQTRLAEYSFIAYDDRAIQRCERIPLEMLSESGSGKGIMLYTPFFDKELDAEIAQALSDGITTVVISSDQLSSGSAYQVWRLNEDHSAELIG